MVSALTGVCGFPCSANTREAISLASPLIVICISPLTSFGCVTLHLRGNHLHLVSGCLPTIFHRAILTRERRYSHGDDDHTQIEQREVPFVGR